MGAVEGGGEVPTKTKPKDFSQPPGPWPWPSKGLMLGPFPQGCRSLVSLKESGAHLRLTRGRGGT